MLTINAHGKCILSLSPHGDMELAAFYEEENLPAAAAGMLQITAPSGRALAFRSYIGACGATLMDLSLRGRFASTAVFPAVACLRIKQPDSTVVAALTNSADLLLRGNDVTTLPNPGTCGGFSTTDIVYAAPGLVYAPGTLQTQYGAFATPTAGYATRTIDLSDVYPTVSDPRAYFAALPTATWPFAIAAVPLNGLACIPQGEGPFPLIVFAHGNHNPNENSTPGYLYLCERLASHGMISATIDVNFLNGLQGEEAARAVVQLEHVKQFQTWNATPLHPLHRKVDLGRIAIVGHSRGGEAVAHATLINRLTVFLARGAAHPAVPLDGSGARPLGPYSFNLSAAIAIAPTDDRYRPIQMLPPYNEFSTVIEHSNYLLIHGAKDADVVSFPGYRCYDRALPYDPGNMRQPASGFKSLLWLYDANHNYFNTAWGSDGGQTSASGLMPADRQREIARIFIGGWAQIHLLGRSSYWPLFRRPGVAQQANWFAHPAILVSQYHDKERLWLQTFDELGPVRMTAPVFGMPDVTSAEDVSRLFLDLGAKSSLYEQSGGLQLKWTSGQHYSIANLNFGGSIDRFQVLSLRVGQAPDAYNTVGTDQDFTITVADQHGHSFSARASAYGALPYPGELSVPPVTVAPSIGGFARKMVMQTVRIPLSDIAQAGVDTQTIDKITFTCDVTLRGLLYCDDLQFSL